LENDKSSRVINLDALTYAGSLKYLENLPDNSRYQFVHGSITDKALVTKLLKEHHIDTIVHFAAESHVDRSIQDPGIFIETNVVGTAVLLEAAKRYWQQQGWSDAQCRFHHISTDEVYGSLGFDDPPFTEQTPYAPNSPYAASKAAADHWVRVYHHTYKLPMTLSNCSNNFGSHQHSEKFIPTVVRACQQQKPIPIYGTGNNVRDWLFVRDHCAAIATIIHRGVVGEQYNIGGNNEWSNINLAKLICQLMDTLLPAQAPHERLISFVTDRAGHDQRYAINPQKLAPLWVVDGRAHFIEQLKNTMEWFLNNQ